MKTLVLLLVFALAACGDAGETPNNGETSDNIGSNATTTNIDPNVGTNNATTNNTTAANNATSGPGCVYIEGDLLAESDDDLAPVIDVNCARIEGDLVLTGAVSDATGIAVTEIGGNLRISGTRLGSVDFERLEQVDGSVIIEGNPALSRIEGFASLSEIGGNLVISDGPITEVTGFGSLRRLEGLLLNDLPFAFDFSGLSGLNTVRTLAVYDVPMLASLEDFERIVTAETLQLYRNDALESASGIGNSTYSRVEVALNPLLVGLPVVFSDSERVDVLVSQNQSLTELEVSGATTLRRFWAISNDSMAAVRVPTATLIDEEFRLEQQSTTTLEMPLLTQFETMNIEDAPIANLSSVGLTRGSSLTLRNLDALVTLDGLGGLDSLPGTFNIIGNNSLTSIEALQGMSRVGTFRVRSNPSLPSCQVIAVAATIGTIANPIDEGGNDSTAVCP